ncbi:hypothetical protein DFH11DRAFT_736752 [Phellopilus nigrolimitatus]|nr:hypothetical protein DFH11DRAFT_736752 [Phellopilus nigrolimitatus]
MGRPLFSTLIAPAEPVCVAEVKTPTYERWSYVNAFDPDADEFFDSADAVYEAPLSQEEIVQQEEQDMSQRIRVQVAIRNRLLRVGRADGTPPSEDERPDLVDAAEDDSSSASDSTSSGRASPAMPVSVGAEAAERVALLRESARRIEEAEYLPSFANDGMGELSDLPPLVRQTISEQSQARSLPTTPTRASPLDSLHAADDATPTTPQFAYPSSPVFSLAQPATPPMTPPGSVTPRLLSWTRPRAVNMSPSPTPNAPFGSARASRMSVAHIAPPVLRVLQ